MSNKPDKEDDGLTSVLQELLLSVKEYLGKSSQAQLLKAEVKIAELKSAEGSEIIAKDILLRVKKKRL